MADGVTVAKHGQVGGDASAGTARARNAVRIAISTFILMVLAVSTAGWIWTGANQAAPQSAASRTVLTIGIAAGLVGIWAIWGHRPGRRR